MPETWFAFNVLPNGDNGARELRFVVLEVGAVSGCHRKYFIATGIQAKGRDSRDSNTRTHTRRCTYRIIIYVCLRRAVNFNFLFDILCTVSAIRALDVSTSHARLFTFVIVVVVVVVVGCCLRFPTTLSPSFLLFFSLLLFYFPAFLVLCISIWNNLIKRHMRNFCHTGPFSIQTHTRQHRM